MLVCPVVAFVYVEVTKTFKREEQVGAAIELMFVMACPAGHPVDVPLLLFDAIAMSAGMFPFWIWSCPFPEFNDNAPVLLPAALVIGTSNAPPAAVARCKSRIAAAPPASV
jgi:hypothetical protein